MMLLTMIKGMYPVWKLQNEVVTSFITREVVLYMICIWTSTSMKKITEMIHGQVQFQVYGLGDGTAESEISRW